MAFILCVKAEAHQICPLVLPEERSDSRVGLGLRDSGFAPLVFPNMLHGPCTPSFITLRLGEIICQGLFCLNIL